MNILLVCGFAAVTAILAVLLKKSNAEYSFILSVCSVVIVLLYVLSFVTSSVSSVFDAFDSALISTSYIQILLKCVGICFITEFTCDCCKDASQAALSNAVLTAGRICVLITALPLFSEFLNLALKLSGGSI